jgi:glycosyltransferase involved in cell wall biosynthesis
VRILLDYRPALRQRTGVGAYIHETARALAATRAPGESVVLFSASWKDRLPADVVPPLDTIDRRIPVSVLNFAWHRLGRPAVERLAGHGFDAVQAAHPLLIPTARAAGLVTVHDLDFLDHPERTRAEIRRDYGALITSHLRRADRVVVVSPHTAREVEHRLGVPPSQITICPPGAPDWPARATLPGPDGCILFLGTLEPRKNLDVLLDAYARMLANRPSTPPLVLAGAATPAAAALVARTRLPPLAGHVEVTGYVTDARKAALYARALVFVLPSHTEGFGMTAVEAMKAGVPVVAANRGALPDTVGAAGALVDPDDALALADTLTRIVSSADMQRHMAAAGRTQAARFTWTHTAHRTREAWHLAVEHRRARG